MGKMRGVAKWLGMLSYGTVGCQLVVKLLHFFHQWTTGKLSVNLAVIGYLLQLREEYGSKRRGMRDGLCLSSAVPVLQ